MHNEQMERELHNLHQDQGAAERLFRQLFDRVKTLETAATNVSKPDRMKVLGLKERVVSLEKGLQTSHCEWSSLFQRVEELFGNLTELYEMFPELRQEVNEVTQSLNARLTEMSTDINEVDDIMRGMVQYTGYDGFIRGGGRDFYGPSVPSMLDKDTETKPALKESRNTLVEISGEDVEGEMREVLTADERGIHPAQERTRELRGLLDRATADQRILQQPIVELLNQGDYVEAGGRLWEDGSLTLTWFREGGPMTVTYSSLKDLRKRVDGNLRHKIVIYSS